MEISASLVKELRERTGAGMMECKKALSENGGQIDAAAEWLRKSGLAKADKKASRIAAEGCIVADQRGGHAVLIEVNSETDFVAKDGHFVNFSKQLSHVALTAKAQTIDALKAARLPSGETVEEARAAVVATVGENIQIRRLVQVNSAHTVATYVHGGRIGVVVEMQGSDATLAREIAMHVAAMNPTYRCAEEVPAAFLAKEKEIESAKIAKTHTDKPPEFLEKIVNGRLQKLLKEITLYGQNLVTRPDQTVAQALQSAQAEIVSYQRLIVGEGIDKVTEDYAAEVMKQAGLT